MAALFRMTVPLCQKFMVRMGAIFGLGIKTAFDGFAADKAIPQWHSAALSTTLAQGIKPWNV
jgi:uncharacterized membrane protein